MPKQDSTDPPASRTRTARPYSLSTRKKLAFAFFAMALCFAGAELILKASGFPRATVAPDPFVGFSKHSPLVERRETESGQEVFRTRPNKSVWFNDQSFPCAKGENTFRIVCLGGSTTFGRPFDDRTSYSQWLRELLPKLDPSREWEVINAGGVSYASYRIASVMEQFLDKEVDLFILYCGQNEFLEWRTYGDLMCGENRAFWFSEVASRTHIGRLVRRSVRYFADGSKPDDKTVPRERLPSEVDEMLNHTIGPSGYTRDQAWARGVENHFRITLERMRGMARSTGTRLAIVQPVSNLRDCRPFKAEFTESLGDNLIRSLTNRLRLAEQHFRQRRVLKCLDEIATINQTTVETGHGNADVEYLRGRCLFENERYDEAAVAFQSAIDLDICPLRATSNIKQIIRDFASRPDVIDVNAERSMQRDLQRQTGHRCFGEESFLDHVHPTIAGHGQIAEAILQALKTTDIIHRAPSHDERQDTSRQIESQLDSETQNLAFRNLAKVLHWSGKFDLAEARATDALKLNPDDLESRFILADCCVQGGRPAEAMQEYTDLFRRGEFDRALIPFAELLAGQGHTEAAKAYLMQAILALPSQRQKEAYLMLGQLHFELGEHDLANDCWDRAEQTL